MGGSLKIARQFRRCFCLVWAVSPGLVVLELCTTFISGLVPVATFWFAKLIIDRLQLILSSSDSDTDTGPVLLLVSITLALTVAGFVCGLVQEYLRELLRHRLAYDINRRIINKALELDLSFFESPAYQDKLAQAQREASYRPYNLITLLFSSLNNLVILFGLLGLLLSLNPWVTVALVVLALPLLFTQNYFSRLHYRLEKEQTAGEREMAYFTFLLTGDHSAKEIKLFGLGRYLLDLYSAVFSRRYRAALGLGRRKLWGGLAGTTVGLVGYGTAYIFVVLQAANRSISLGNLAAYAGAPVGAARSLRPGGKSKQPVRKFAFPGQPV